MGGTHSSGGLSLRGSLGLSGSLGLCSSGLLLLLFLLLLLGLCLLGGGSSRLSLLLCELYGSGRTCVTCQYRFRNLVADTTTRQVGRVWCHADVESRELERSTYPWDA